jgi:hypothetical protein
MNMMTLNTLLIKIILVENKFWIPVHETSRNYLIRIHKAVSFVIMRA